MAAVRREPGRGAARQQVPQDGVQAVRGAGALVDQVIVSLGQQSEDRGLVLRGDLAQVGSEKGDLSDVQRVGRVGLAVIAGRQETGPGRQGRGHIDKVLVRSGQLLGGRPPEPDDAFDGEATLGPLLAPAHQLTEGFGVDDGLPLANLVACGIDREGGVRGLVGVDSDGDHARPDQVLGGAEVCGGHPDLKVRSHTFMPLSSHTARVPVGGGTLIMSQPRRAAWGNASPCRPAPWTLRLQTGRLGSIQQVRGDVSIDRMRARHDQAVGWPQASASTTAEMTGEADPPGEPTAETWCPV